MSSSEVATTMTGRSGTAGAATWDPEVPACVSSVVGVSSLGSDMRPSVTEDVAAGQGFSRPPRRAEGGTRRAAALARPGPAGLALPGEPAAHRPVLARGGAPPRAGALPAADGARPPARHLARRQAGPHRRRPRGRAPPADPRVARRGGLRRRPRRTHAAAHGRRAARSCSGATATARSSPVPGMPPPRRPARRTATSSRARCSAAGTGCRSAATRRPALGDVRRVRRRSAVVGPARRGRGRRRAHRPTRARRPPAARGVARVGHLARRPTCEPRDIVANRLDPWHGAWLHPYAFSDLAVDDDAVHRRPARARRRLPAGPHLRRAGARRVHLSRLAHHRHDDHRRRGHRQRRRDPRDAPHSARVRTPPAR